MPWPSCRGRHPVAVMHIIIVPVSQRSGTSVKYSKRQDLLGCHYICTARARSRQHDDQNTRTTTNVSDFVNIQAPLFLRGFRTIHPKWCAIWYARAAFQVILASILHILWQSGACTVAKPHVNRVMHALQWGVQCIAMDTVHPRSCCDMSCDIVVMPESSLGCTPNPRPLVTPSGM
jgi:hypothetical protein